MPKSEEKTVAEFTHEDVKKASEHFEREITLVKFRCHKKTKKTNTFIEKKVNEDFF